MAIALFNVEDIVVGLATVVARNDFTSFVEVRRQRHELHLAARGQAISVVLVELRLVWQKLVGRLLLESSKLLRRHGKTLMDRWQERAVHRQGARVLGQLRRRGILIEQLRLAEGADFVVLVEIVGVGVGVQPMASLEGLALGAEDLVSAGPLQAASYNADGAYNAVNFLAVTG